MIATNRNGNAVPDVDKAHQHFIDPPAIIPPKYPHRRADDYAGEQRVTRNLQRDPGSVNDPRQDIATQTVTAQDVIGPIKTIFRRQHVSDLAGVSGHIKIGFVWCQLVFSTGLAPSRCHQVEAQSLEIRVCRRDPIRCEGCEGYDQQDENRNDRPPSKDVPDLRGQRTFDSLYTCRRSYVQLLRGRVCGEPLVLALVSCQLSFQPLSFQL